MLFHHMVTKMLAALLVLFLATSILMPDGCEALLRARVLNSTTADATDSRFFSSNTLEAMAPHYEMHVSDFNVTGRLYNPSEEEEITCILNKMTSETEQQEPTIILVFGSHRRSWACTCSEMMCHSIGCVGIVNIQDVTPIMAGLGAHIHWNGDVFEHLIPMVVLPGGGEAQRWLLANLDAAETGDSGVQVTITSGDVNDFALVLQSVPWKIWGAATSLHSFGNVLSILYKFQVFRRFKELPRAVPFVLIPEIFANCMRLLLCISYTLFENQLLAYWLWRVLVSVCLSLGIVSTVAISVLVFDSYRKATSSQAKADLAYKCSRVLTGTITVILILDLSNTWFSAFFGELVSTSSVFAFYTLLQIPVSVAFIHFGNSAAKLLLDCKSADEERRRRRLRFSRQVKFSGVAMLVHIGALAAFVIWNEVSAAVWLYLMSFIYESSNAVASFQINAVRTPKYRSAVVVVPSSGKQTTTRKDYAQQPFEDTSRATQMA